MTIVTGVIFCGLGCFCVVAMIDEYEFNKIIETVTKWTFFLFILFTLTFILIPGDDTLLMMQAAKLATIDNVNGVFEALKGAIDYAVSVDAARESLRGLCKKCKFFMLLCVIYQKQE